MSVFENKNSSSYGNLEFRMVELQVCFQLLFLIPYTLYLTPGFCISVFTIIHKSNIDF